MKPIMCGLQILIDVQGFLGHARVLDAIPDGCMFGAIDLFRYLKADGPARRNAQGHG